MKTKGVLVVGTAVVAALLFDGCSLAKRMGLQPWPQENKVPVPAVLNYEPFFHQPSTAAVALPIPSPTHFNPQALTNEEKDVFIAHGLLDTIQGGYLAPDSIPDVEYNWYHVQRKTGKEVYADRMQYGVKGLANLIGTVPGQVGDSATMRRYMEENGDFIEQMGQKYPHVSPEMLAALIEQESSGLEKAISPTGALGSTQLTKYIYLRHADEVADTVYWEDINPFQTQPAIERAARHLNDLFEKSRAESVVLAKYNQGPQFRNADGRSYARSVQQRKKKYQDYFRS